MKFSRESKLIMQLTPKSQLDDVPTFVKGDGVYLEDADGRQYVDMTSGNTRPVSVGYGRKEIAQACYDQMMQLAYITPLGRANEPAVQLAERIARLSPESITHVTFESSGSDAVEAAMKFAQLFHAARGDKGRFKIISRKGAYHGVNGLAVRALGVVRQLRRAFEPGNPGGVFVYSPYCYRCPFGQQYPGCKLQCALEVEKTILFEGPETVSAFIGEPIQQGFGSFAPPKAYWDAIRDICTRYGVLLIEDEVICGFGRTGKMFAAEHFGIQPDLMTMGKGMTSGYFPLSGLGVSTKLYEAVDTYLNLHTYSNHPVGCAVASAVIDVIEAEGLIENSATLGAYLRDSLRDALKGFPSVGEVRGLGLWVAVDFTTDKTTRAELPAESLLSLSRRAQERGYLFKGMGSAVELCPPLHITREAIDAFIPIFVECVRAEERALGLRK